MFKLLKLLLRYQRRIQTGRHILRLQSYTIIQIMHPLVFSRTMRRLNIKHRISVIPEMPCLHQLTPLGLDYNTKIKLVYFSAISFKQFSSRVDVVCLPIFCSFPTVLVVRYKQALIENGILLLNPTVFTLINSSCLSMYLSVYYQIRSVSPSVCSLCIKRYFYLTYLYYMLVLTVIL